MNKPTKLTKVQLQKISKAALYSGISAAIGYLITWLDGNPEALGMWTVIVNTILVTVRQVFKTEE